MPSYGISEPASGLQNRQDYSGMITPAEHKAVLEGEVTCQHMPVAVHVWGDYCFFFWFTFLQMKVAQPLWRREWCFSAWWVHHQGCLGWNFPCSALCKCPKPYSGVFPSVFLITSSPHETNFFFYPGFLKKSSTGCCSAFMCDTRQ